MRIVRRGTMVIILVLVLMLASVISNANAQNSPDLEEEIAVLLTEIGLLKGDQDGNLMLDNKLTREQMVVIISRLKNVEDEARVYPVDGIKFKDVPEQGEYKHYIAWAQGNKIILGYSSERFGFKDYLTGWQAKAILVRTLGYTETSDEDMNNKADELGITTGVHFDDDTPIMRRTMAVLMYNSLFAKTSEGKILGEELGIGEEILKNRKTGKVVEREASVRQDGWVYYKNTEDGNKLYKAREDGSTVTKLDDGEVNCLDVSEGWVYFSSKSDQDKLYKISINGVGKVKLGDYACDYIDVYGDWIYFINKSDYSKIYRMKLDGTGGAVISQDSGLYLRVQGDWVYYRNVLDSGKLYRINVNGSGRMKIVDDQALYITVSGDWIQYTAADEGSLTRYMVRTDGTGKKKISKNPMSIVTENYDEDIKEQAAAKAGLEEYTVENLDIEGDWIYYSNADDGGKLYKVKTDGTGNAKVDDDECSFIDADQEWIYFVSKSDYGRIYRIRPDGTDKDSLNRDYSAFMCLHDGWIYYRNLMDEQRVYRMGADGENRAMFIDEQALFVNIIDDWVYYNVSEGNSLTAYKMKLDGTGRVRITQDPLLINVD